MDEATRIFVAGHRSMVGGTCWQALNRAGYTNLLGPISAELDLARQTDEEAFFQDNRLQVVILAAAREAGILANATYPADFLTINLAIQTNVIGAARQYGVRHPRARPGGNSACGQSGRRRPARVVPGRRSGGYGQRGLRPGSAHCGAG